MNINMVYECDVYRLYDVAYNNIDFKNADGIKDFGFDNALFPNHKVSFVKSALVYYSILQGGFIDMETGQFYTLGYPKHIGEMFVDFNKDKKYGKDIMGTSRRYYSKKKILKRYSEYKTGENNEHK